MYLLSSFTHLSINSLHLQSSISSRPRNYTRIASVQVRDNENWLAFSLTTCHRFYDINRGVDVFGICNPTTPLLLQNGTWNKVHVTTRRSQYAGKFNFNLFSAIQRNDHCPYAEDVECIIFDIGEKPSVLHLMSGGPWASVNCISGKISGLLEEESSRSFLSTQNPK